MWEIIVWRSMWYTVFTGITVLWREGGKTENDTVVWIKRKGRTSTVQPFPCLFERSE